MQEETPKPEQPPDSTTEPAPAANAAPRPETPPQPRPTPASTGATAPAGPPPRFLENLRAPEVTQPAQPAESPQPAPPPQPAPSAQPEFTPDQLETVFMPLTLTVGSGFKFGCGFLLAVAFASLALFLLFSVIFFVASLMGLPLPLGTP